MKPMTSDQKLALRMMAERNLGAVVTRFGWTWPQDCRESEEKASAVVEALCGEGVIADKAWICEPFELRDALDEVLL